MKHSLRDLIPPMGWMYKIKYVYLISAQPFAPDNSQKFYKIGFTKNIDDRLKLFAVKLPFRVTLIHSVKTMTAGKLEIELHKKFQNKIVNGEWFALSESDLEYIKSL